MQLEEEIGKYNEKFGLLRGDPPDKKYLFVFACRRGNPRRTGEGGTDAIQWATIGRLVIPIIVSVFIVNYCVNIVVCCYNRYRNIKIKLGL